MTSTLEKPRMGLYNPNFQMSEPEILEERLGEVRGKKAPFIITAGPLKLKDITYEDTYVLEIRSSGAQKLHSRVLGPCSFGSHLFLDYAMQAHELAMKFCEENGFEFSTHLNSWPEFQAVIFRR